MNTTRRHPIVVLGLSTLLLLGSLALNAAAHPSYFTDNCASCHTDDTPTCNGCHQHRGTLHATADLITYAPGAQVTVTLTGGTEHGWVRGLLYDHNGTQIAIRTGPTGMGDDGLPNPVTFPVMLQAPAPTTPGDYTWQAAWYGNNNGAGHEETRTPVAIHVAIDTGVHDGPPEVVRSFAIAPNPLRDGAALRFDAGPRGERVNLAILDVSGRRVRQLWNASVGPGAQQIIWDATDDTGSPVPSGTYFAILLGEPGRTVRALEVIR